MYIFIANIFSEIFNFILRFLRPITITSNKFLNQGNSDLHEDSRFSKTQKVVGSNPRVGQIIHIGDFHKNWNYKNKKNERYENNTYVLYCKTFYEKRIYYFLKKNNLARQPP